MTTLITIKCPSCANEINVPVDKPLHETCPHCNIAIETETSIADAAMQKTADKIGDMLDKHFKNSKHVKFKRK